jgi:hypothetical protein
MAELEIHTEEHGDEKDSLGKKVGAIAAIIAVGLAVVTISAHRAHTEAIITKTEAADQWAFYQAKSLKSHTLEVGNDLLAVLGPNNEASAKIHEKYEAGRKRYEEETKEIMGEAKHKEAESAAAEHRALRFDLGEGLLEIGLVMTSLYFLGKKKLFPIVGVISAVAGVLVALTGALAH